MNNIHNSKDPKTPPAEVVQGIKKAYLSTQNDLYKEDIEDRKQDRELRKSYATRWFWVVLGQLAIVNIIFIIISWKYPIDAVTLRIFFGATILEVFGVIYVITKNLFPNK